MGRALVLGGGGVGGIAWETGLLAGLADAGIDVLDTDLAIGTSAGATVGAQVLSGIGLEELFARQVDGRAAAAEIPIPLSLEELIARYTAVGDVRRDDPLERRRKMGAATVAAATVPVERRRDVIALRLPNHAWPEVDLRVVAVDTSTGLRRAFTRDDGVSLVDAVAASCAVPLVWPPVPLDGTTWMDGGAHSDLNIDLAAGHDPILVLAPGVDPNPAPDVLAARRAVEATATVLVLSPDPEAQAAMGPNPLDVAAIPATARAGREQGLREAARVRAAWPAR